MIEQFPKVNDTYSCSDIIKVEARMPITTSYPMFIAIYRQLESDAEGPENGRVSFAFNYESGSCGGVFVASSGIIKYKDNEFYSNKEYCVWLVQVPQAESIYFELESGEFEEDCDYITVSSVKELSTWFYSTATVISSENPIALVNGSVAIVTFFSDETEKGTGFRLYFRMEAHAFQEPTFSYQLFHQDIRTQNLFAYKAEPNQVAIVAFSAGTLLKAGIQVDITSFRPQVNESCSSDLLYIFEVNKTSSSTVRLTKTFTSADVDIEEPQIEAFDQPRRCIPLADSHFQACKSKNKCSDAPIGGSFRTNASPFYAIYSNVNVSGDLQGRGFAIRTRVR
ncbi:unnamed protein product [Orchesella dallaii]